MKPRNLLTSKEVHVAILVWEGSTNRDIANTLGTTEQVVKNYLRAIFDKLGVWSRLELALYVASHGGEAWQIEMQEEMMSKPTEEIQTGNRPIVLPEQGLTQAV